jgi:hypothetical protein
MNFYAVLHSFAPSVTLPKTGFSLYQRIKLNNIPKEKRLLGVGRWRLAVGFWLLGVGGWLLAVGFWLLAIGFWLLAISGWLLGVGFWLLAISGWLWGFGL